MPSRREFLQNGLLASAIVGNPVTLLANNKAENEKVKSQNVESGTKKNGKITFLQTKNVNCQLHEHDELFRENDFS